MIDIDVTKTSEQRKFGIVMAVAITVLGLLRFAVHGFEHFPVSFLIVAAVFLFLGLLLPIALRPILFVWLKFAIVLNWIMTRVMLGIAFYLMFAPVRFIIKIFSEDPLKRAWLDPQASYWEDAEEQPQEFERYLNQF